MLLPKPQLQGVILVSENPNCCFPYKFPFPFGPYPGDKLVVIRWILQCQLALTKDDDATAARVLVAFELHESERKDLLRQYDVIVVVSREDEADDVVGDVEFTVGTYNIEVYTVDHDGVTGWKLRNKANRAIKQIIKEHPLGSHRKSRGTRNADEAGSPTIYHTIHSWEYAAFRRD